MKKHIFADVGEKPFPDMAPNWIGYTCIFCHYLSGLNDWQLRDMPLSMAECQKSTVKVGFFERIRMFFGGRGVDCLTKLKGKYIIKVSR